MTAQILVVDDEPDMKALVLQKFRHQIGDGAINFLFASDGIEAPGKRGKRFNDHGVGLWRHEQYSRCDESRRV